MVTDVSEERATSNFRVSCSKNKTETFRRIMRLPSSGFNSPVLQVDTAHFSSSPSNDQSPWHVPKNTWTSGTSVGTSSLATNGSFFFCGATALIGPTPSHCLGF